MQMRTWSHHFSHLRKSPQGYPKCQPQSYVQFPNIPVLVLRVSCVLGKIENNTLRRVPTYASHRIMWTRISYDASLFSGSNGRNVAPAFTTTSRVSSLGMTSTLSDSEDRHNWQNESSSRM
eukprot:373815-Ditylum_brightwellii.AAC.1